VTKESLPIKVMTEFVRPFAPKDFWQTILGGAASTFELVSQSMIEAAVAFLMRQRGMTAADYAHFEGESVLDGPMDEMPCPIRTEVVEDEWTDPQDENWQRNECDE
jgi:hypothetical protein